MLTVYLPGHSDRNRDYALELAKRMRKKDRDCYARHWAHWDTAGGEFQLGNEVEKTMQILQKFNRVPYNLITKSIGNLVATEVLGKVNHPELAIMMGIPREVFSEEQWGKFTEQLQELASAKKLLIVQNEKDPVGSAEQTRELLENTGLKIHDISREQLLTVGLTAGAANFHSPAQADHLYQDTELLITVTI